MPGRRGALRRDLAGCSRAPGGWTSRVFGLDSAPVEAVRLLRLLVAYGPRMTRKQRERAVAVAALVPLDHPDVADLLVDVARAGDRATADAIFAEEDWTPGVGDEEALAARLADVIDDGPTHEARAVAIEIVARFDARGAARSALRRALRLPSFSVRARALDALATATPSLLLPEDLVQVLRDLVTHAPPDPAEGGEEREEDERRFADAVIAALAHVRSEDAAEALLDWIDAEHDALWLDAAQATEALAVGFPETGAVMIDHWLRCARAYDRARALGGLEAPAERVLRTPAARDCRGGPVGHGPRSRARPMARAASVSGLAVEAKAGYISSAANRSPASRASASRRASPSSTGASPRHGRPWRARS